MEKDEGHSLRFLLKKRNLENRQWTMLVQTVSSNLALGLKQCLIYAITTASFAKRAYLSDIAPNITS